jgi:hypothetical protein
MTTAVAPHRPTTIGREPMLVLASTVLSVVMRVAGPVPIDVHPHALSHPERQVTARIGDAVVYLTEPAVAARIRQQWDAAHYLATARLPARVSRTWLTPAPGTYPVGVALRLAGPIEVTTHWISARRATNVPTHVRIRVDRLVWQVCDQQAWRRIADAWFTAQRYLPLNKEPPRAPGRGAGTPRMFTHHAAGGSVDHFRLLAPVTSGRGALSTRRSPK